MTKKTAVVLLHGIGEQIPMETLKSFIDAVWSNDPDLVDQEKPHPDTGLTRDKVNNASWSKPDRRNRSFDLQRITTESGTNGKRIDFFEYYWAHRVTGTTWEQVKTWVFDLLCRNPFKRVPRDIIPAWLMLWSVAFLIAVGALFLLKPSDPSWIGNIVALGLSAITALIIYRLTNCVGDIVRYVKAEPKNIAIRQSIRENGVRLLETLMGIKDDGSQGKADYDRIIVVGHSLGTIVGYDILAHTFARLNRKLSPNIPDNAKQPKRAALEELIRDGLNPNEQNTDLNTNKWAASYRELQEACRKELNEYGNPWIVSDFITLGSPLTHAEFLMEEDENSLELAKTQRILPTCPPTMEYDGNTNVSHFSYRLPSLNDIGSDNDLEAVRIPHHSALFAYTRWTNIYSQHKFVFGGDIISGKLDDTFGLKRKNDNGRLSGIYDIAVMPGADGNDIDRKRRWFTHCKYWDLSIEDDKKEVPFHIVALREALALGMH